MTFKFQSIYRFPTIVWGSVALGSALIVAAWANLVLKKSKPIKCTESISKSIVSKGLPTGIINFYVIGDKSDSLTCTLSPETMMKFGNLCNWIVQCSNFGVCLRNDLFSEVSDEAFYNIFILFVQYLSHLQNSTDCQNEKLNTVINRFSFMAVDERAYPCVLVFWFYMKPPQYIQSINLLCILFNNNTADQNRVILETYINDETKQFDTEILQGIKKCIVNKNQTQNEEITEELQQYKDERDRYRST